MGIADPMEDNGVKVIVLGGGVVGVSTAYYLSLEGHDVEVIDRQAGVGLETSFANAGLIAIAHASPWAAAKTPWQTLGWLGRSDAPVYLRFKFDPAFWSWGLKFLRHCTDARETEGRERLKRMVHYSLDKLIELRTATGIAYHQRTDGFLSLYRSPKNFAAAAAAAEKRIADGAPKNIVEAADCLEMEPALKNSNVSIAGGIHSSIDESGDAFVFTQQLAEFCRNRGVEFRFNTSIKSIESTGSRITGIRLNGDDEPLQADAYVLALGSYSRAFARTLGLDLPIYPIKGYSVTLPITDGAAAPSLSLADEDKRIGMSRLGGRMRIAGTAEIAGFDLELNRARCRNIAEVGKEYFPDSCDHQAAEFWTGLRPVTPDGPPILGKAGYDNLFLNTGHGTLGWTMACGSGRITADLIAGRQPEIKLDGLTLARYQ